MASTFLIIDGDITLESRGRTILVEGVDKIAQYLLNSLMSKPLNTSEYPNVKPHVLHSLIAGLVGSVQDPGALIGRLNEDLNNLISRMKAAQVGQILASGEKLQKITDLSIEMPDVNSVVFTLAVQTDAGPKTFELVSSNVSNRLTVEDVNKRSL